ncbi:MAG: 5'/3'-nucleotidase SurE [Desulfurococcales archaeon]|nr:5'/3'-nucleotidase SurE [Desulfurococcales archaeon]
MGSKILLVNDDGFMTLGLPLMFRVLQEVGEVIAVVPETPKSGGGHSLTLHKPIFLRELKIFDIEVHVVNGTPVDAFHAAVSILGFKPDIVFSGVNIGENTSSQNILYSGTVQAAVEAGLFGFPSVAVSADVKTDAEFEIPEYAFMVRNVVKYVAKYVLENGWFTCVDTLSINLPATHTPKGAVIPSRTQRLRFRQGFVRRMDPRGREYYWLVGEPVVEEGTDTHLLKEGYVTVSPLRADMSASAISCSERTSLNGLVSGIDKLVKRLGRYAGEGETQRF